MESVAKPALNLNGHQSAHEKTDSDRTVLRLDHWTTEKELSMSDLKHTAKDKIEATANAAKKATGKVVDKAKDLSHSAGKKMDDAAKKLKKA